MISVLKGGSVEVGWFIGLSIFIEFDCPSTVANDSDDFEETFTGKV